MHQGIPAGADEGFQVALLMSLNHQKRGRVKLTAKPVDNRGFPWMGVDIQLACGAGGRRWWTAEDE
jgi:hypothetical protein